MRPAKQAFRRDDFGVTTFLVPEAPPYFIEVNYGVLLNFGNADYACHDYVIVSPISTSTW